ncbi:MAG: DUF2306 domain-containing protein [Gammaproteobacteria bacterium]
MSSVPNNPTPMTSSRGFEKTAITILKAIFASGCVFYAVMAFDYFISFALGRDGLWMQLFSATVSDEYAFGTGSVHVDQQAAYESSLRFLLMHTTMGAICMALGPFQFVASLRVKYRSLHRTMGKVYLVAVLLSMTAGLGYLSMTPFTQVFSGAPFAIGLVGLHFLVLYTAYKAYAAIRRKKIAKHQYWMAMNYGLLLSTPVLRLLWITFGLAFPSLNQAEANLAITTFLIPVSVLPALIWIAAQRPRSAA